MLAQRKLMSDEVFEIVVVIAAVVHALGDVRPAHAGHRRTACGFAGARFLENIAEIGIEAAGVIADGLRQIKPAVVGAFASRLLGAIGLRLVGRLGAGRRLFTLEQRIALELGVDEFREFEVGELQQPDGLLQLRRHHQLLALPQL